MNYAIRSKISSSKSVIDLGCGNSPIRGATVAVDCFLDPKERSDGNGQFINIQKMNEKGIKFVNSRIDVKLPFEDKEFDFAYSHHVFEHLDDPGKACDEMMRIAKSGVIITPSFFSELAFGREYHKWLVMDRKDTLLFFRKRPFEDRPFGHHPEMNPQSKTWEATEKTNPFDILLNDGGWYKGEEKMPRLASKLQSYYNSHNEIMEVCFLWDEKFKYHIYE